jgi:hypothetical protein
MLSALEESDRNLGELERARSLTMAQQETVTYEQCNWKHLTHMLVHNIPIHSDRNCDDLFLVSVSRAMQMERVKTEHEREVEKVCLHDADHS